MRTGRTGRNTAVVALLAGATLAAAAVAGPPRSAAADTTAGRVTLQSPTRLVDTRMTGGKIPAGAAYALPAGLVNLAVIEVLADGTADIHPCAAAPSGDPTIVFKAHTLNARATVNSGVPMCITSTQAFHLVADQWGTVADTPFTGGLQYRAFAEPIEVYDGSPASTSTVRLPRDPAFPAGATGATYLVESIDPQERGFVTVWDCAGSYTPTFTLLVENTRTSTIVNVPLGATESPCFYILGRTRLRITALGHLSPTGPDPTSLPPSLSSTQAELTAPGLRPVTPRRVLDTRQATALRADVPYELDLRDEVTPATTAVVMNVTVTQPEAAGYLTVWPCDRDQPDASNLNFSAGQDVPNLVTVRLGTLKNVCIVSTAPTHVLADLAGTYEYDSGSVSTAIAPERILDTRNGIGAARGALAAGSATPLTLQVAGRAGVPTTGAVAITMNVTVTGAEDDGYLTVWPCDQDRPEASNLNFVAGTDVPNLVTVKLSALGTVCFFSTATTHVLADASMWYSPDATAGFVDLAPERILDTRGTNGVPAPGKVVADAPQPLVLQVAGRGGVPATGATAVTMNVTVANPEADGYLTVWPCDQDRPTVSNLNFRAGTDVPNLVVVKLSATGTACFATTGTTDVIADVAGYSTANPVTGWKVAVFG